MTSVLSRRKFISEVTLALGGLSLSACSATKSVGKGFVPDMKVAYAAITWGGNDIQAIKEISSLGFKGIQLRSNVMKDYGAKPEVIRELLVQNKLKLPMFSSGNANINTGNDEAVIQSHIDNARFVKALGGENMQITNSSRPKTGAPATEDLIKYGKLLNEIGRRTLDLGVQTNYHNHMGQLGQTPEEVEAILENSDSKNVKFLLDIAHYFQGGGDPVTAYNTYKQRIGALHLKDVRPNPEKGPDGYQFVELGRGKVDLAAIFKTLNESKFSGWGIVELDGVPEKDKTPMQSAIITKNYLRSLNIMI